MAIGFTQYRVIEAIFEKHFPKERTTFSKEEVLFIIGQMEYDTMYVKRVQRTPNAFRVFRYFVQYCFYRNLANYDSLVLLTGNKGVGKSSFAIMLAREWCRLLGRPFKPDHHIAYTNPQMVHAIETLPRFSPLIADEAVNFATREGWALRENKDLKIKMAQIRTRHLLFILCFPLKIYKIDKTYLESYCNYWIDLYARGKGILYVRDANPVMDSWRLPDFKNIGAINEFTPSKLIKMKLSRHPNFWHLIRAPRPPPELYAKYLRVREANVYNDANARNLVTKHDIVRMMMMRILKDVMARQGGQLTVRRIMSFIKLEYDYEVTTNEVENVFNDADMMFGKLVEEGVLKPRRK